MDEGDDGVAAALTHAPLLDGFDFPGYRLLPRQAVRTSDHATPRNAMLIRAGWLGQADDPR